MCKCQKQPLRSWIGPSWAHQGKQESAAHPHCFSGLRAGLRQLSYLLCYPASTEAKGASFFLGLKLARAFAQQNRAIQRYVLELDPAVCLGTPHTRRAWLLCIERGVPFSSAPTTTSVCPLSKVKCTLLHLHLSSILALGFGMFIESKAVDTMSISESKKTSEQASNLR